VNARSEETPMKESAFAVQATAGPALRLAERIAAFDARAVTPRAKAAARMAIIDTAAALMSGACTPFAQWVVQTPGVIAASGPCVVAGTTRRTTALDAALANATAACATQRGIRFAVLFALAEEHKLSGERFFSAWLAGEAVASGLQNAAPLISTVAAASHLLRLDAAATALAVSMAAASGFEDRAHTTPLCAGQQARAALLAVMLAARGDQAALHVPRYDPGGMLEAAAAAFGSAQENDEADTYHDNCDAFTTRCAAAIGASEALTLYERLEAIDEVSDIALLGKLMAKRALPGASSSGPLALSATPGDGSDETAWVP
jgi:hypothetical protein